MWLPPLDVSFDTLENVTYSSCCCLFDRLRRLVGTIIPILTLVDGHAFEDTMLLARKEVGCLAEIYR